MFPNRIHDQGRVVGREEGPQQEHSLDPLKHSVERI